MKLLIELHPYNHLKQHSCSWLRSARDSSRHADAPELGNLARQAVPTGPSDLAPRQLQPRPRSNQAYMYAWPLRVRRLNPLRRCLRVLPQFGQAPSATVAQVPGQSARHPSPSFPPGRVQLPGRLRACHGPHDYGINRRAGSTRRGEYLPQLRRTPCGLEGSEPRPHPSRRAFDALELRMDLPYLQQGKGPHARTHLRHSASVLGHLRSRGRTHAAGTTNPALLGWYCPRHPHDRGPGIRRGKRAPRLLP